MADVTPHNIKKRLRLLSLGLSLFGSLIGLLALIGWFAEIPVLKREFHAGPSMMPTTAVTTFFMGLAALFHRFPEKLYRTNKLIVVPHYLFLLATIFIGAGVLVEHYFKVNLGLDWIIGGSALEGRYPGRPSPEAGVSFVFIGSSLLLYESRTIIIQKIALVMGMLGLVLPLFVLTGYLSGEIFVYNSLLLPSVGGMAPNTALSLACIAVANLLNRTDSELLNLLAKDNSGGIVARRLFAAFIFMPMAIAFLHLFLTDAGFVSNPFLQTFNIYLIFTLSLWITWSTARQIGSFEDKLRQSEERFRNLVALSPDAIFIANLNGEYTAVNAMACNLLELSQEEIIGKTIEDLIPAEDIPRLRASRNVLMTGQSQTAEWRLKKKSGAYVPVEVSAAIIPGNDWLGFVRDITFRKRLEEEQEKAIAAEKRLRIILENIQEANQLISEALIKLPSSNLKTVLHTILLQAQKLVRAEIGAIGVGNDSNKPFDPWVFSGISDEVAQKIGAPPKPQGLLGVVLNNKQPVRLREAADHPAMGRLPPYHPPIRSFLGVPIQFHERNMGNIYLANKQGNQEFSYEDQLTVTMLATRAGSAIELAHLYTDLKEMERLREEWISVVAHDLRQPISVITMAANLIKSDHLSVSEDENEKIEMIISNAAKLNRMIADLLDASLIETRQLRIRPKEADLKKLVEKTAVLFEKMAPGRQILLQLSPNPACRALIDEHRIEQILNNLFSNALKYSIPNSPIEISLEYRDHEARVSVSNYGRGLSQDETASLFQRFHRVAGTENIALGIGLGLYITKALVEAHHGKIWVNSIRDGKTTFTFSLPTQAHYYKNPSEQAVGI